MSNNRDELFPTLADEKPRQVSAFCAPCKRGNFAALRLPPQTWELGFAPAAGIGKLHVRFRGGNQSKTSCVARSIESRTARASAERDSFGSSGEDLQEDRDSPAVRARSIRVFLRQPEGPVSQPARGGASAKLPWLRGDRYQRGTQHHQQPRSRSGGRDRGAIERWPHEESAFGRRGFSDRFGCAQDR